MKKFLLRTLIPDTDVDFLNETSINFEFVEPSGWCDGATGCRILSANDSVIFKPSTTEEELFLNLKYRERLAEYVPAS